MAINVGDKVRFLNDVGGGTVSRIEGNKVVYVLGEDGFEVPALLSEVVLVEKKKEVVDEAQLEMNDDEYGYDESDEEGDPKVILACVKDKMSAGSVKIFLVNDANFFVFYTIGSVSKNQISLQFSGLIEPNTKLLLSEAQINQLDGIEYDVQLILFRKNISYQSRNPVLTRVKFSGARLLKDGAFVVNDYFDEKANLNFILKGAIENKLEELNSQLLKKIVADKEEKKNLPKVKRKDEKEILEVDLHIHELLDDTRGLSNKEILDCQLEKFHQVMEENKNNRNKKIVFIHGIGNGVLKTEIRKALDRKYKWHSYQDASFKEYGYGATMVII
jgi:hypothetical protein